ncbi:MAG TPA: MarR family transcriptional regulator [Candidatus Tetragenococcus pullicola]|nr:MarR family transcriptional regulator [Candidatus Tetragenococcus pullicola]
MIRYIGNEMRDVQQMLHQKMENERKTENAVSFIQMRTLTYIYDQSENVYQRDLEKELHIRRSTATQILKRLERDHYIYRESISSDARLKKIVLTPLSLGLIDRMRQHMEKTEHALRQDISNEDLNTFFAVLDQMKKNLE